MKVIKRDGSEVPFDISRIENAIGAANAEVAEEERLPGSEAVFVMDRIRKKCEGLRRAVGVEEVQDMVVSELIDSGYAKLALHYSEYRLRHEMLRKQNSTDKKVLALLRHDNELAKQENANKNQILNSTMRDYLASEVSEDICRRYIFPEDVVKAHDEGIIHVHDLGYVSGPITICELVNLEDMLQNGTVITDTLIEKPHSFSTACNIATQIIAQVASNTFDGQTISLAHLAPFVDISRQKFRDEVQKEFDAAGFLVDRNTVSLMAEMRVKRDITKGIQTIQYQIQTLLTTNGQTPFVSAFMYLDEVPEGQTRDDLAMIIEETLKQRIEGIKNEVGGWVTPAFPKLLYVLDEDNITSESRYWYLTELAAKCTAKRMVPDYISAKMMRELKGDVYACMGCRSFLTPDQVGMNPDGSHKYYGRYNQGVVTINLVDVACSAEGDEERFWQLMEERTELCHKALRIRHETLWEPPSSGSMVRLQGWRRGRRSTVFSTTTIPLSVSATPGCMSACTG